MEQLNTSGNIVAASFEELEALRLAAVEGCDYNALRSVADEARSRDGYDDTDARFNYLARQCEDDIKNLMTYYG